MAGLYIHIPFCAGKCAYCDFYSRRCGAGDIEACLGAMGREMEFRQGFFDNKESREPASLSTIYVGGGTPSLLSPEQLNGLLDRAAGLWDCSGLRETTLEANPEDLTDDYIARLRDTRFDRLSIGIQSFDDGLLCTMNRRHSAERARQAVRTAQKVGFDNISIDLIFGIPGMSRRQWERSLDEAVAMGVQHISAYHLTIEKGTVFGAMERRGVMKPISEAESEWQYDLLCRRLANAGFDHYEISNFACPGFRAVHNSSYWSGEPYLGIGPSAHSFDGRGRREWVVADIDKYLKGAGTDAIYDGETLSQRDLRNERVMIALRTARGIEVEALAPSPRIDTFIERGLLALRDGRLVIPPERLLLSDWIIGELFEE